ncbi:heme-degrading domain-containing protein [Arthrobacter sp. NPDC056493]|uniref:heme-degrading domain-containing protein n=1 Tax=Arthrobacter sp. NPDC056493 TaxID=3345839 RepID=UPI00366FC2D7
MIHHAEPGFDPDARYEQPEASLQSLIERLEYEARTLHLNSFDQADALALGLLIMEIAQERNLPIAIDIRRNEHVLFHVSLPGATPDNDIWVQRKSRTTERYAEPSLLVGLRGRVGGGRLEDNGWFNEARYASHGGAFPIFVKNTGHVATATVSGLPQKDDHDLVVEALTSFRDRSTQQAGRTRA